MEEIEKQRHDIGHGPAARKNLIAVAMAVYALLTSNQPHHPGAAASGSGRAVWIFAGHVAAENDPYMRPLYDALTTCWTLTSWSVPGKGIIEWRRWRSCAAAR